jgi:hypothetical protein
VTGHNPILVSRSECSPTGKNDTTTHRVLARGSSAGSGLQQQLVGFRCFGHPCSERAKPTWRPASGTTVRTTAIDLLSSESISRVKTAVHPHRGLLPRLTGHSRDSNQSRRARRICSECDNPTRAFIARNRSSHSGSIMNEYRSFLPTADSRRTPHGRNERAPCRNVTLGPRGRHTKSMKGAWSTQAA